jgi:hypothetical protein
VEAVDHLLDDNERCCADQPWQKGDHHPPCVEVDLDRSPDHLTADLTDVDPHDLGVVEVPAEHPGDRSQCHADDQDVDDDPEEDREHAAVDLHAARKQIAGVATEQRDLGCPGVERRWVVGLEPAADEVERGRHVTAAADPNNG